MEHAARLLPDGGLPGANDDERILRSLALLICFLGTGHHCDGGAFRLHVRKLVEYMGRHLAQIPREEFRALTIHCLRAAEAGGSLPAESVTPALRLLEKATLTIPKAWAELQI